jgi:hypothetical protein
MNVPDDNPINDRIIDSIIDGVACAIELTLRLNHMKWFNLESDSGHEQWMVQLDRSIKASVWFDHELYFTLNNPIDVDSSSYVDEDGNILWDEKWC